MNDEELTRLAAEELIREAKKFTERREAEFRATQMKQPLKANKRFLNNTIQNVVTFNKNQNRKHNDDRTNGETSSPICKRAKTKIKVNGEELTRFAGGELSHETKKFTERRETTRTKQPLKANKRFWNNTIQNVMMFNNNQNRKAEVDKTNDEISGTVCKRQGKRNAD